MGRARRRIGKKLIDVLSATLWRNDGKYPDLERITDSEERAAWGNLMAYVQIAHDCERYHCLPSQLADEDYHLMQILRSIHTAEQRYDSADRKARATRPPPRGRR